MAFQLKIITLGKKLDVLKSNKTTCKMHVAADKIGSVVITGYL